MTGSLLCEHDTSLFGCPYLSHALLSSRKPQVLFLAVGQLDLGLLCMVQFTTLAYSSEFFCIQFGLDTAMHLALL